MSNHHTRKTFFAKALAGLTGLGLLGGARLRAKNEPASPATVSDESSRETTQVVVKVEPRAVARSIDSL